MLVGSCHIFREGLRQILKAAGFKAVVTGSSVADILSDQQSPPQRPIVLLIDVGKDYGTVLREMAEFKSHYPTERIALLAEQEQLANPEILNAFHAGAHAYLAKQNRETLIKSLELLLLGETIMAPQRVAFMLHNENKAESTNGPAGVGEQVSEAHNGYAANLTAKEICILRCLISGDSNKTIAQTCSLQEPVVKVHVKAIYRKICVRNRTQAAIWALSHNLVADRGVNTLEGNAIGDLVGSRNNAPAITASSG
jgi:two-component system nitrate/nitrite response regulator NarL